MGFIKSLGTKFRSLKKWQKVVIIFVLLSILVAVSGTGESTSTDSSTTASQEATPTPEPTQATTLDKLNDSSVKWENYSPTVKQRIADLVDAGDCDSLQTEFNNADTNSTNQRNRTGESNANLMALIDDQMKNLGCY